MKRRNLLWSCVFAGTLVCGGLALAQKPVANIDAKKNPNLAAAQRHISQAYEDVEEAQKQHPGAKFGGHAEKAQELMTQADTELKLAAEYIDTHK